MLSAKLVSVIGFVLLRRPLDAGIIDGNIVEITFWRKTQSRMDIIISEDYLCLAA